MDQPPTRPGEETLADRGKHKECDCEECLAHHHDCDCDDCEGHDYSHQDVNRIARCVRELECAVHEVLECLDVEPDAKHQILTFACILLKEIEEIEKLLRNRCFGLREIKNEVRFIENEVILINNSVNNPVFGLNEIKNEVRFIENEVILINNAVNNPVLGLNEIKNEVRFIENEVILINNAVNNPVFGLNEIKNEIRFIEKEVILINNSVNNPVFGLNEIKNEIRLIENQMLNISSFCPNVTSGSIFVEASATRLQVIVAVKNRNTTNQTVRVRVLRDDVCPANVLANELLLVSGCCKNEITAPIDRATEYEIEVFGLVPGMSVSSVELNAGGNPVSGTRLTNTQFFCFTGNCP